MNTLNEKRPAPRVGGVRGKVECSTHEGIANASHGQHSAIDPTVAVDTLIALLDGCGRVYAAMPWGKPGPIVLPDDPAARRELIGAHVRGGAAAVTYAPKDGNRDRVTLKPVVLTAACPADDGRCRWMASTWMQPTGTGSAVWSIRGTRRGASPNAPMPRVCRTACWWRGPRAAGADTFG